MDNDAVAKADMSELCNFLSHNEEAQCNIYNTYRRAADMDEAMRELKKEERFIRLNISKKIGV